MPPPKSQNQRQLRKRYSSNGCSRRVAEERLPVDRLGVDAVACAAAHAVGVAVPGQVHLVDLAELPRPDDLAGLDEVRHAPLLRADLHDALVLVLGLDDRRALGQIVRQRLLDVDVLAGRAGVDGHRHVPVVGRADQHGVDVLAVEQLVVAPWWRRPAGRPACVPSARCASQTSQTAAIRTPGILASDCISCRQRPPVPMQPT